MTLLDTAPDALLAERSAEGDETAFAVLVRRHAPYLRAFALRLTRSAADADDCLQDALITAWEKLPGLSDRSKVRAWLTTIVSRKATDRIRARHPHADIADFEVAAEAPGPERQAVASSRLDALRAALDSLADEQRIVWLLKEVGGHSYGEIAEQLGTSPATVRGRLARARAAIVKGMEEWR